MIIPKLHRPCRWLVFLMGTGVALVAGPTNRWTLDSGEGTSIEFIHLPAGEFMMGCPEKPPKPWTKHDFEVPQHKVRVSGFSISIYPITVAQFCDFLNAIEKEGNVAEHAKGVANIQKTADRWQPMVGTEDFAASGVAFDSAEAFCSWLAVTTGVNCRLPTEAEWEYAAKGQGTDRVYPWGKPAKVF